MYTLVRRLVGLDKKSVDPDGSSIYAIGLLEYRPGEIAIRKKFPD